MSTTFTASAAINNKQWPFSFVCFGTRPNDTAAVNFISKGSSFLLGDNSSVNDNEIWFFRDASGSQAEARTTTTYKVADGKTHLAVTVSSGGVVKLYKNGSEVGTYTSQISGVGTVLADNTSDLVVDLNSISHFAYYDVALTSGEISTLYAGGAGVSCYSVQSSHVLVSTDTNSSSIPVLAGATYRRRRLS